MDTNQGSKIIVIDTTVKNNLGQSVSNQQSFIVHQGQYYIGVKTDPYFVGKDQPFNLKVKTVDDNGKEMSVGNITADIYAVTGLMPNARKSAVCLIINGLRKKTKFRL